MARRQHKTGNRQDAMRFTVWAMGRRDEGRGLTPDALTTARGCSRATAYRLLADYFDVRGWQWPPPAEGSLGAELTTRHAMHPWKIYRKR